jgi:hypothetical protein
MTQTERDGSLAPDAWVPNSTPDFKPDHLSIFSAPGVEIVFHWWFESNRRWAAHNATRRRL